MRKIAKQNKTENKQKTFNWRLSNLIQIQIQLEQQLVEEDLILNLIQLVEEDLVLNLIQLIHPFPWQHKHILIPFLPCHLLLLQFRFLPLIQLVEILTQLELVLTQLYILRLPLFLSSS